MTIYSLVGNESYLTKSDNERYKSHSHCTFASTNMLRVSSQKAIANGSSEIENLETDSLTILTANLEEVAWLSFSQSLSVNGPQSNTING